MIIYYCYNNNIYIVNFVCGWVTSQECKTCKLWGQPGGQRAPETGPCNTSGKTVWGRSKAFGIEAAWAGEPSWQQAFEIVSLRTCKISRALAPPVGNALVGGSCKYVSRAVIWCEISPAGLLWGPVRQQSRLFSFSLPLCTTWHFTSLEIPIYLSTHTDTQGCAGGGGSCFSGKWLSPLWWGMALGHHQTAQPSTE